MGKRLIFDEQTSRVSLFNIQINKKKGKVMEYKGTSVDPVRNRFRYYNMYIEKNLFNEFILTTNRGRIGCPGKERIMFGTYEECKNMFESLKKVRKNHGYVEK